MMCGSTRGEIIEDLLCVADRIWVEEVVAAVAGLLRGLVHDLVPADGVADHPEVELADARQEHVVRGVGGVQHLVHAEEVARELIRVGVEIAHVPLCSKGRGEHPDGDVSHSGREVEVDVGLHAPSRDAVAPTHLPPAPHDAVCASSRRWTAADDAGRARGLVGDEAGATPVLLAHVHAARRLDAVTPRERRGGYVGGGEVRLCGPALAVVVVPHLPPGPRAPRADRRSADDRAERARRFGAEAGRLGRGRLVQSEVRGRLDAITDREGCVAEGARAGLRPTATDGSDARIAPKEHESGPHDGRREPSCAAAVHGVHGLQGAYRHQCPTRT